MPTRNEIACTLIHINALKKSKKEKNLVILEDDARFNIDVNLFKQILEKLENYFYYDIVILGFSKSDYKSESYINLVNPFLARYKLKIKDFDYSIGDRYFHTTRAGWIFPECESKRK